jgi:hypothetical protein
VAILFKDLWGESTSFFEFTALFGSDVIEIGNHSYRYGEITTRFLNYDPSEYKKAMSRLKAAHGDGDYGLYALRAKEVNARILATPLYQDFSRTNDLVSQIGQHVAPEGIFPDNDGFRHYGRYLELENVFDTLLPRYRWFLREMFYRDAGKRGDNRYACQIEENGMSAFVSGVSLGLSNDVDPAKTSVKYEVKTSADGSETRLYEKMNFSRLTDFLYADFFKALMKENTPKQCKLCGRYFLQEKGVAFEYCDNPSHDGGGTCRQKGALTSFRDKVKENEVWQIHQRAYKKYYARVLHKKMSKADFEAWARRAEQIRAETLPEYEAAIKERRELSLEGYTARLNDL